MAIMYLVPEFARVLENSPSELAFRRDFWRWLAQQEQSGPLAPLLGDMATIWKRLGHAPSRAEAQATLLRLADLRFAERAHAVLDRFEQVSGQRPELDIILLAGLGRPEGYSRFHEGSNTIFIGLDHPNCLGTAEHFEIVLSHELCHALRDPSPRVLADYGGSPTMSHDDFVARYSFGEHLVSESLAGAVSELCFPKRSAGMYSYHSEQELAWCRQHHATIVERLQRALRNGEHYQTFYSKDAIAFGAPECCDYYLGLHFGRYLLQQAPLKKLLYTPAKPLLADWFEPFCQQFCAARPPSPEAHAPGDAINLAVLPADVRPFYTELRRRLQEQPAEHKQQQTRLEERLWQEGLQYAGEPWDVYTFPIALGATGEAAVQWACQGIMEVVETVVERYRQDPEIRAFFALPPHLEEWALLEPGYRPYVGIGRFDCYWDTNRLRFLELNTNGTAAFVLNERLAAHAAELNPWYADYGLRPYPLRARLLASLLAAWHEARGEQTTPRRLAIVDFAGQSTASELQQLAAYFAENGLESAVVDPSELHFDGHVLSAAEQVIDLVYRRFTTDDVMARPAALAPLVAAYKAGSVVMVGGFCADIAHSKRLFAALSHERCRGQLSAAQCSLIDAHIPWTRVFRPQRTIYEGRLHDLRELALAARERFVLKPAEKQEGRGVLLGVEAAPEQWREEVDKRLGGDFVIQELVEPPLREIAVPCEEGYRREPLYLHLGAFMLAGRYAGGFVRCSRERVLSASSTEAALPFFGADGA